MPPPNLIKIKGTIADLHIWDGEENFVMGGGAKAVGGATAIGAAAAGLAGAAATAVISSGDTQDAVEFFTCTIGDRQIFGRFGNVTFKDYNDVVMAVEEKEGYFEAYAICRPEDRKIWMYPHCSKGRKAYWKACFKNVFLGGVVLSQVSMVFMGFIMLFQNDSTIRIFFEMWLLITPLGMVLTLIVGGGVALMFSKFARLSSSVFNTLGFKSPDDIDLPQRLDQYLEAKFPPQKKLKINDGSGVAFSKRALQHLAYQAADEKLRKQYNPEARWVYRY